MKMDFWALEIIFAKNESELKEACLRYCKNLEDVVDEFIENTCWSENLPGFVGHKGSFEERLTALRQLVNSENPELNSDFIPLKENN